MPEIRVRHQSALVERGNDLLRPKGPFFASIFLCLGFSISIQVKREEESYVVDSMQARLGQKYASLSVIHIILYILIIFAKTTPIQLGSSYTQKAQQKTQKTHTMLQGPP
jgi:hypothetical protein